MQRLDHPNIIRLFEIFEDEKRYYLSMELCTGGELLDDLAKNDRFDEETSSMIIQQIMASVAYCHRQNIVHRNLKLENILIDSKKSKIIKIKDF